MALIVLATVIDGMDASVVNVVLPDMAAELGMTVSSAPSCPSPTSYP